MNSGFDILGLDSATFVVAILIGFFCLMALWSGLTRLTPDEMLPALGNTAKGIFLAVQYRSLEGKASVTGHVTTLSKRFARIVGDRAFAKGERIEIDLGSLSGYPDAQAAVIGTVAGCEILSQEPTTYMITVRFSDLSPEVRSSLSAFIGQLAAPGRLSHA